MAGSEDLGGGVVLEDGVHPGSDWLRDGEVAGVEACVDEAAEAVGVLNFLKVGILYPVLPVNAATERSHDLIGLFSVAHEPVHLAHSVVDVQDLTQLQRHRRLASPGL